MATDSSLTRRTYDVEEAAVLLARTPAMLDTWLRTLPDAWLAANEGPDTWSAFDIVGHLVHGERTDWMPRVRRVLEHGEALAFDPFDRFAQFEDSRGKTIDALLDEFARLRASSLEQLRELSLTPSQLELTGRHPAFGLVTLRQLLATWVAHDLDHVAQIARVIARQYSDEVGPWREYLRIVNGRPV
ncbi:MAG TPA: DinB family protein [Luteitalea sp.]|nr:DinB family protein [Luteitalea sp.]